MISELNSHEGEIRNETSHDRREQLLEVSVFLFLIVPSMAVSFFAINQGNVGFVVTAVATILRDLALVSLILFFAWRNGEPVKLLGWNFKNAFQEVILGAVLFVPLFFGASILDNILQTAGFSSPSAPLPAPLSAKGPGEFLLAILLVIVVAFAEETIFRGYLILRFKSITASTTWAVLLSAVIFSLGHGYEGSAGVVTVGAMGAVFAIIYLWRKSLVAPMTMHFLQDFLGIVLIPLLGMMR